MVERKNKFKARIIKKVSNTYAKQAVHDYVDFLANSRKVIFTNFFAGVARGFGVAIGFTILGALVVYFLQRIAYEKLPIIGDFIGEIVKIVQHNNIK